MVLGRRQVMNFVLRAVAIMGARIDRPALAATNKVFVADEESSTVSVLDAGLCRKTPAGSLGREPHNVQISPDGKLAWVTNNGEQAMPGMGKGGHAAMSAGGEVWAIDTASHAVVAKIPVGKHPAHVVLTPDGRFAYVTNGGEDTVSAVDIEARKVVATIAVGAYPHGIRVSPSGQEAYVANLKGGSVSVIDIRSQKEVAQIPVGKGPAQTGFAPDGRLAFVSLSQENKVALFDPAARKVVKTIGVGTVPIQVYATPEGTTLFVANQGTRQKPGKTVSVIDLAGGKVTSTVQTGPGAHGVVVDREGRYAYVTNIYENSVSVLDVSSAKVVRNVRGGEAPTGIR